MVNLYWLSLLFVAGVDIEEVELSSDATVHLAFMMASGFKGTVPD